MRDRVRYHLFSLVILGMGVAGAALFVVDLVKSGSTWLETAGHFLAAVVFTAVFAERVNRRDWK